MPDLHQAVFLQFFVVLGPLMRSLVTKNIISQIFEHGHFFKKVSFRQKLNFWDTYSARYLIKVVRMDRTDHLGFR